jgi:hypothetical protein
VADSEREDGAMPFDASCTDEGYSVNGTVARISSSKGVANGFTALLGRRA